MRRTIPKTRVIRIRIEEAMYRELKRISEVSGTPLSRIARHMLYIGYMVMRPDIKISVRKLIMKLVPDIIDEIEKIEKLSE